jgi:hypothetical protein
MKWKTYDKWHLTTSEIMADTGAGQSVVSKSRRRWAPETVNSKCAGARHDWTGVDWSKRTRDIAAELGRSVKSVSVARSRYAPQTKTDAATNTKRGKVRRVEREFMDACDLQ